MMTSDTNNNERPLTEDDKVIIPVVKETAFVDKVTKVIGTVTVDVTPVERQITESIDLTSVTYREKRVPVDSVVTERPEIRHENGVTIIPVIKEEVIITKQLRLVEEIHLIRDEATETAPHTITVREDEVTIVRE